MDTREIHLLKSTKNTYVYEEEVPVGGDTIFPIIYIQKTALPTKPQRIRITLEEIRHEPV